MAHPRRFGLACHVGLAINKPTIGVAKSHLFGTIEGQNIVGANGAILGRLLKEEKRKPSYVSVGHRITLDKAVQIVRSCALDNYPVPLRIAHNEAVRLKEKL